MTPRAYELMKITLMIDSVPMAVMARPVEWDKEDFTGVGIAENGDPCMPTKWQTTCPGCGLLVEFKDDDIITHKDEKEYTYCLNCASSREFFDRIEEELIAEAFPDAKDAPSVFVDPIKENIIDISQWLITSLEAD